MELVGVADLTDVGAALEVPGADGVVASTGEEEGAGGAEAETADVAQVTIHRGEEGAAGALVVLLGMDSGDGDIRGWRSWRD